MVTNFPAMWETWVQSLDQEDTLEKEMAIHSSILAWKIPCTEEPGQPQTMGSQRVRHDWATELNWKLIKISTVIPYLTSIIVAYSSITEGEGEVAQLCPTLCDPVDCNLLGFSVHGILQQEYWSGLPFPSPGYLPDPGIEPGSPALEADALTSEPPGSSISTMDFPAWWLRW